MNRNSEFSVYVVELQRYVSEDQDLEVFVPQVFGEEVRKEIPGHTRQRWDETSFFRDLEGKVDPTTVAAVRKLYEFAKARADIITWGTGTNTGSFNPKFLAVDNKSLFTVTSRGEMRLNFGWLTGGKAVRDRLWAGLKEIPELSPYVRDRAERCTVLPPQVWVPHCERILGVFDQVSRCSNSGQQRKNRVLRSDVKPFEPRLGEKRSP